MNLTELKALWHAVRNSLFGFFYESYLAQALLIVVLLCLPYLFRTVKRCLAVGKIRRTCRKKGYTFRGHRAFYPLGNFRHRDCEFSVCTPKCSYAVKLIGVKNRHHHVTFTDECHYNLNKSVQMIHRGVSLRYRRLRGGESWHAHPEWRFFTQSDRSVEVQRILLMIPASDQVEKKQKLDVLTGKHELLLPVQVGEDVFGAAFHTQKSFLSLLEENHERYTLYTDDFFKRP